MIIDWSADDGPRLLEAADFRRFKVVVRGDDSRGLPQVGGITFVDEMNALVAIDLVPGLPGAPHEPQWLRGFGQMVEAARVHGWIDASRGAIRAHVERVPGPARD